MKRSFKMALASLALVGWMGSVSAEIAWTRSESGAGPLGTRQRVVKKTLIFAERQIYWPGANVLHEWQDRALFHDATLRQPQDDLSGMQRGFLRDVEILKDVGLDGFGAIAYHPTNVGHLKALERHPHPGYAQMPIISPTDGGANPGEGVMEATGLKRAYDAEKQFVLAHAKSPYAARVDGKLLIWTYGGSAETNLKWAQLLRQDPDIPPFIMMGPMPFTEIYEGYGYCNETGRLESGKPNRIPQAKLDAFRRKVSEYAQTMGGLQVWCVNRRRDWNGEYPVITEATPIYRDYLKPICEEVVAQPENQGTLVGTYLRQGYFNKYQGTTDGEYGTATLRAYLDEIVALNPDVLMGFEWNEQNENTFFQPTVAHGKTWTRILNFYRAYLDRETPRPMKGDDPAVPNLVVSTRQSIKLGEKYHLELLYLPDGAAENEVKVQVTLKDETGETLVTLPEETISTVQLKAIDYRIASEQFAGHVAVTPELKVCYGGRCRKFTSFDATRLTATVNRDFLYTHQPLREALDLESVDFTVTPADQPNAYRVAAAVKSAAPLRSLEIVDGLEEVAAADADNWFDNEKYALFRMELSATKPELLGNGVDRWLSGTGRILNAPGDIRATNKMWETGGVNGPKDKNFSIGFAERQSSFFVRVLRSELSQAQFELNLPRLGRHVADLARIEELGKYSWELAQTVRYTIKRLDDLADIPAPLNANAASLARTLVSAERFPALQLRVVAMDGKIYRSSLKWPRLPGPATETINVFSETQKKPVAVTVPTETVPVLDYVFEPTWGQNLKCEWGAQFDGDLGGGTTPGSPMHLAAAFGKLPKDFVGPAGAKWMKGASGWELDFENGEYLILPRETLPMAAEYTLDFELWPRTSEDQVLWRSTNTHAPDEGLQVLMKGGTLHLSYYGIHWYHPLDFDTKAKLNCDRWNQIRIVRRYDRLECEVNGVKSSFKWDRRSRHFTGMIFGANVKPNDTAPAGIKPFDGRLRALKIQHRVNLKEIENPVIREDWPDPTIVRDADGTFYSLATHLKAVYTSRDFIHWQDLKRDPLTPSARRALTNLTQNVWAPSLVKLGKKWCLYISLFVADLDNRIEVLTSDHPYGPFEYVGNILQSAKIGIQNSIDPYVFTDEGRVWMFFGSAQDGVHRVELAADGLKILEGAKPVHVAGFRKIHDPKVSMYGMPGAYEGSYLLKRGEWWYLFLSGGRFYDGSYHLAVGRSRSVTGEFVTREGKSLVGSVATPILKSEPGDRFVGPGHNGDVYVTPEGRYLMPFHAHDVAAPDKNLRHMLVQEIKWTKDAWPYFDNARPALKVEVK